MPAFAQLCRTYRAVTGTWPTNAQMIGAALGLTNRAELYDVWGHPYGLYPSVGGSGLLLVCYGADGKPGGSGENADFTMQVK
jgi:hypothetical protein